MYLHRLDGDSCLEIIYIKKPCGYFDEKCHVTGEMPGTRVMMLCVECVFSRGEAGGFERVVMKGWSCRSLSFHM